jgi:hypothetical protein
MLTKSSGARLRDRTVAQVKLHAVTPRTGARGKTITVRVPLTRESTTVVSPIVDNPHMAIKNVDRTERGARRRGLP